MSCWLTLLAALSIQGELLEDVEKDSFAAFEGACALKSVHLDLEAHNVDKPAPAVFTEIIFF
jgi:hypothetical protein